MFIVRPFYCHDPEVIDTIIDLLRYPNSSIVPTSSKVTGFDDFILLSSANMLIEDVSTFSYWAGVFSNAKEKHVLLDYHGIIPWNRTIRNRNYGYIYHDFENYNFFGRLQSNGTIIYDYYLPPSLE